MSLRYGSLNTDFLRGEIPGTAAIQTVWFQNKYVNMPLKQARTFLCHGKVNIVGLLIELRITNLASIFFPAPSCNNLHFVSVYVCVCECVCVLCVCVCMYVCVYVCVCVCICMYMCVCLWVGGCGCM